jgi:hypothetical protein
MEAFIQNDLPAPEVAEENIQSDPNASGFNSQAFIQP